MFEIMQNNLKKSKFNTKLQYSEIVYYTLTNNALVFHEMLTKDFQLMQCNPVCCENVVLIYVIEYEIYLAFK